MTMLQVAERETNLAAESLVSLTGKVWRFRQADPRAVQKIIQQHNLQPLVASILAARGTKPENVAAFLQPKLRDFLPDPFLFRDMDKACERIAAAIRNKEKIALFGDYDVDGATSTALMARYLRHFGLEPTLYIPDRMTEGYGPNIKAFQQLIDDKHTLIITLDCGVLAYDPIALAADKGVDVVVLDHHMAAPELPRAVAIVNPNRLDETTGFGYLAAVGVTFVTLVGLSQKLRQQNIEPPDLMRELDLVALGTVCDVVPLIDLNRALVSQGLKVMARRENIGIRALSDQAGLDQLPNAYHMGFVLGPRINAGGRIASSHQGVTLLSTSDGIQAEKIALSLERHNKERQVIEKQSVEEALGIVSRDQDLYSHMIVVGHEDWHPGVIGLIAARLKEHFQRPTAVIAYDATSGKGKASARSVSGIDLGALVIKARLQGLIPEGGGHAMAAGFSVMKDKTNDLLDFFQTELRNQFGDSLPAPEIKIDAQLAPAGVNMNVAKDLQQLEPFGQGNASPKLLLSPLRLQRVDVVKEKHLRLNVSDLSNQQRLSVMMFNQAETPLHRAFEKISPQQSISLLGSLKVNTWQGRQEAQFLAEDAAILEG